MDEGSQPPSQWQRTNAEISSSHAAAHDPTCGRQYCHGSFECNRALEAGEIQILTQEAMSKSLSTITQSGLNYGGTHVAAAAPAFAASTPMPWASAAPAVAAALLPARPDMRAGLAPFVPFEPPLPGLQRAGAADAAAVAADPFHDDWPFW
jgi:hypothetical protein